ncbi:MAG TPA: hypothetical protein VKF38_04305 [Anaerolineaceae bacterium]|nr:hypothetical protein [Anaerolineaceae bacterium]
MMLEESNSNKWKIWIAVIFLAMLVGFILAFHNEISQTFQVFMAIISYGVGGPTIQFPVYFIRPLAVLAFNLIGFFLIYNLWQFIISSQALLPVKNITDVRQTLQHLRMFIARTHGPAVFIKDGALVADPAELKKLAPGVILIDFNSAVVLERQVPLPSLIGPINGLFRKLMGGELPRQKASPPRACGNGLVFTRGGERIRGVVDLRRQWRNVTDVHAYTREGIELSTSVFAAFTIGQDADILQVTYDGERRAENLRVVYLENLPDHRIRVCELADELDEADRSEIHQYANDSNQLTLDAYFPLEKPSNIPVFNAARVFAAVYSEARNDQDQMIPWVDLPVRVAIDLFREQLSRINYDDLYKPDNPDIFPLKDFKKRLKINVRNTGILSYRLIVHQSGELISGRKYNPAAILVSPVRTLFARKVLRDRGIKIIGSSFGDLIPVSEAVYKQRLDNWRARWETDAEVIRAGHELEAMRVRARSRAQAQQELIYTLSQIFQNKKYTQEALAVRVMQALETVAFDQNTRQLLPTETIDMMRSLHDWLLGNPQQPPKSLKS